MVWKSQQELGMSFRKIIYGRKLFLALGIAQDAGAKASFDLGPSPIF